ncbi:DUF2332 domain-containing protein [Occultella gossypii]|uniref:DUF2332 domain-containing protein n=1 Tax=Occultella gossypii TaxID=2800820 RepID=A0ABS7S6E6_9MICO|nr:DUF2332 domain-containing protein [Occultella gossypii]MBZ2194753.1 DUF2332 domain-containing protein [Occultella gossypii]
METQAPDTAGLYRRFARLEAGGSSPVYEALCLAIAESAPALALLAALPRHKRQPNLLLGALRWFGAPVEEPTAALALVADRAEDLRCFMLDHATQTNEVARCAVILPALALVPGPVALLELGASAGLCLLPDRWSYEWSRPDGSVVRLDSGRPDSVRVGARVSGQVPLPAVMPDVVTRLGLDAHPIDAADPEQQRWLECLIWPEHAERAERLHAALAEAAADPPPIRTGLFPADLPAAVDHLREQAPTATVVVLHSAAVAYLDADARAELATMLAGLDVRRLGLEGAQVTRDLGLAGVPDAGGRFVLSLDDRVLGTANPHGRDLDWLAAVDRCADA